MNHTGMKDDSYPGGMTHTEGDRKAEEQEQLRREEEFRYTILSQILDQQARARLSTLKISKPEKAKIFENMLIRMAQTGQIRSKLDDAQFVSLLEKANAQMPRTKNTVKYDRRRAAIDSDDEDYDC